jgi:hypothetical protein
MTFQLNTTGQNAPGSRKSGILSEKPIRQGPSTAVIVAIVVVSCVIVGVAVWFFTKSDDPEVTAAPITVSTTKVPLNAASTVPTTTQAGVTSTATAGASTTAVVATPAPGSPKSTLTSAAFAKVETCISIQATTAQQMRQRRPEADKPARERACADASAAIDAEVSGGGPARQIQVNLANHAAALGFAAIDLAVGNDPGPGLVRAGVDLWGSQMEGLLSQITVVDHP